MARTFQNIRLFGSMSVFDNVRAATQLHRAHGIRQALWRGKSHHAGEKEVEDRVLELLEVFSLQDFRDEPATSLPYGAQRRLEIVRAMATQPWQTFLERTGALDGYLDGLGYQTAMDGVLDALRVAVRRG
jgi:branched-chain amino acid transport system ATP-binding protein